MSDQNSWRHTHTHRILGATLISGEMSVAVVMRQNHRHRLCATAKLQSHRLRLLIHLVRRQMCFQRAPSLEKGAACQEPKSSDPRSRATCMLLFHALGGHLATVHVLNCMSSLYRLTRRRLVEHLSTIDTLQVSSLLLESVITTPQLQSIEAVAGLPASAACACRSS